jgi:hypothetical protein
MPVYVAMVALATLIVKANNASPIFCINGTVFEPVRCGRHWAWNSPNNQFNDSTIGCDVFESCDEFGGHVDNYANTIAVLSNLSTVFEIIVSTLTSSTLRNVVA